MWAKVCGSARRRAIESAVRDAGMIVVCVDAIAEVVTEKRRIQSHVPSTSVGDEPEDELLLLGVLRQEVGPM